MTKSGKRSIAAAVIAIFTLILAAAVFIPSVTASAGAWDGTVATGFAGGSGSSADPYQIATAEQLAFLAQEVNKGTAAYKSACYVLTADIVLNENDSKREWSAIGLNDTTAFSGTFDGAGHTVSDIYISTDNDYQGLFGYIKNATINNVGIVGGSITGDCDVGSICGFAINSEISACYNTADIISSSNIGGIVGRINASKVSRCYNTGEMKVKISGTNVGGIAGVSSYSSKISDCYNIGIVRGDSECGGIVGFNTASNVSSCYSANMVIGTYRWGGICGYSNNGTATNCYFNSDVFKFNGVGTDIPANSFNTTGLTSEELCSGVLPTGFSASIWEIGTGYVVGEDNGNGRLNILGSYSLKDVGNKAAGELMYYNFGISDDDWRYTIPIYTADDLQRVKNDLTANYTMMNDIDFADIASWTPVGNSNIPFTGKFSGDGYVIKNLKINSSDKEQGIFGISEGTIMLLGVDEGSVITTEETAGGIVGINKGTIYSCYYTGSVNGKENVGGIAGENSGTIDSCYSIADITSETTYAGGIAGYIDVANGGAIKNCYSSSTVNGTGNVGSICGGGGATASAGITNCYYNTDTCTAGAVNNQEISAAKALTSYQLCKQDMGELWQTGSENSTTQNGNFRTVTYTMPSLIGVGNASTSDATEYNFGYDGTDDWRAYSPITTETQLRAIGTGASLNGNYVLMNDIAVTSDWTSIGSTSAPYSGRFSGDGHKVTGITVDTSSAEQGLFGAIDETALVMSLAVTDAQLSGSRDVGGICGNSNGVIYGCYFEGSVKATGGAAGSICGVTGSEAVISNCYAESEVNASAAAGGIAGTNAGSVKKSYFSGEIEKAGIGGGVCGSNSGTVSSCYYNKDLCSYGGVAGADSTAANGLTSAELSELTLGTNWNSGDATEQTNGRFRTGTYIFPSLKTIGIAPEMDVQFYNYNYNGTDDWRIYTPITSEAELSAINSDLDGNYVLMNDITVSSAFAGIGSDAAPFTGRFSGDGYEISGMSMSGSDKVGLFNENRGLIMHTAVAGSVSGADYVGGVCGNNLGTIYGCSSTADVNGNNSVGGICGYNNGDIINCYSTGAMSGSSSVGGVCGTNIDKLECCYSIGTITGTSAYGVCGENSGNLTKCYYNNNYLSSASSTVNGLTTMQMTSSDALVTMGFDTAVWGKNVNDKSAAKAYYPDLLCIRADAPEVGYQTKLQVEVLNTDTIYYGDAISLGVSALVRFDGMADFVEDDPAVAQSGGSFTLKLGNKTLTTSTEILDNTIMEFTYDGGDIPASTQKATLNYNGTNSEYIPNGSSEVDVVIEPASVPDAMLAIPQLDEYEYGTTLAQIKLPTQWSWQNNTIVADVVNTGYVGVFTPTAEELNNFDWSKVGGFDSTKNVVIKNIPVTIVPAKITTADITLDVPEPEVVLDTTAETSTAGVLTAMAPVWYEKGAVVTIADYGRIYDVSVTISTDTNHKFVSTTKATVNGVKATAAYVDANTLTVTYTFEKTDRGAVTAIVVKTNPQKMTYEYLEEFDAAGGVITATYQDGSTEDHDMTNDMISGYDNTQLGSTTFTVAYENQTTQLTATIVPAAVKLIEITGVDTPEPEKTLDTAIEYTTAGIALSAAPTWTDNGANVTTADYGRAYTVSAGFRTDELHKFTTATKATVNGLDATVVLNSDGTVTVNYTFDKTPRGKVVAILVKTEPKKMQYIVGEELDVKGGVITARYQDGTTEDFDLTPEMISGFDSSKLGDVTLTVTLSDVTTTLVIEVLAVPINEVEIVSVDLPQPEVALDTEAVCIDEGVDSVVSVIWREGSRLVTIGDYGKVYTVYVTLKPSELYAFNYDTEATINGEEADVVLNRDGTITASYEFEATTRGAIVSIAIKKEPTDMSYQIGEAFKVNGGVITATFQDGSTEDIKMTADMISGFDSSKAGDIVLTVTYDGKTAQMTATITLIPVKAIDITGVDAPVPETSFDITADCLTEGTKGITSVIWQEGNKVVEIADYGRVYTAYVTVAPDTEHCFTKSTTAKIDGEKGTVKLNADGTITVSRSFTKTERGEIASISIKKKPTKTVYEIGEEFEVKGGVLTLTYQDGSEDTLTMTADMVSGFDSRNAGEITLTVTYSRKKTEFTITVNPSPALAIDITSISLPVPEQSLDTTATCRSTGVAGIALIEWTEGGNPVTLAGYGGIYTVNVTVSPDNNHKFTSKTLATINGEKASTVVNRDGTLTASYTFPKTSRGSVAEISIKKTPTKMRYELYEPFDTTGGVITATYQDGSTEDFAMTAGMIKSFENDKVGSGKVELLYQGFEAVMYADILPAVITLADVTGIDVPVPEKTLDTSAVCKTEGVKSISKLVWTEDKNTVAVADYSKVYTVEFKLTPDDNHVFNSKSQATLNGAPAKVKFNTDGTLSVTYTFEKTPRGPVAEIAIKKNPKKMTYELGEKFDPTGGVITATYKDGSTEDFTLTPEMITSFGNKNVSDGKVVITFEGKKVTLVVKILPAVITLAEITDIDSPVPEKKLDTSAVCKTEGVKNISKPSWSEGKNSVVEADYSKVYTVEIELTPDGNHVFNSKSVATVNGQEAKVKYNKDGTLTVTYTFAKTPRGGVVEIAVKKNPKKMTYELGERFDPTGGIITATYKDGSKEDFTITSDMITYFGNKNVSDGKVVITYQGKSATIYAEILPADITMVAITGIDAPVPEKSFDTSAVCKTEGVKSVESVRWMEDNKTATRADYSKEYTVEVILKPDSNHEFISKTTATVNGDGAVAKLNSDGTLTVTYTFPKTTRGDVASIAFDSLPQKKEYLTGDELSVEGGRLKLTYMDGSTEVIPMTASMVTGFDTEKIGIQVLKVTYAKLSLEYNITMESRQVSKPVFSPEDGTEFVGEMVVTIATQTEGAKIYYTLDGTIPTVKSKAYSNSFVITTNTVVRAIAVKEGRIDSEVAIATYYRKITPEDFAGNGSGVVGAGQPMTKPSINGDQMTWASIIKHIKNIPYGSKLNIALNGNNEIPLNVMKAIDEYSADVTFAVNDTMSWNISGLGLDDYESADLSVQMLNSLDVSSMRGVEAAQFYTPGTNNRTAFLLNVGSRNAGKFASLYKQVGGRRMEFVDCSIINTKGEARFDISDKGQYAVVYGGLSEVLGDVNNDGLVNNLDATAILKDIVGLEKAANPDNIDYDRNLYDNVLDASGILKDYYLSFVS